MLEELTLQGMELAALRHALDSFDPSPFGLDGQHQTRADQAAVDNNAAGPTVARAAAFLGAGEAELVAQRVQERRPRIGEEPGGMPFYERGYMLLHQAVFLDVSPARAKAIVAARRASTPAILVRNSAVPRLSVIGATTAR